MKVLKVKLGHPFGFGHDYALAAVTHDSAIIVARDQPDERLGALMWIADHIHPRQEIDPDSMLSE